VISLTSVTTLFGTLKSIKEAADSLISLRDEHLIMGKVAEINSKLIDAQQGIFAVNAERSELVQTVGELEKEIADLKAWNVEKERYQLIALVSNVMAYRLRSTESGTEPTHLLCANCFTDGKKSFLNQNVRGTSIDIFKCNRCGNELRADKDDGRPRSLSSRRNEHF
jgi:hypothetical protein